MPGWFVVCTATSCSCSRGRPPHLFAPANHKCGNICPQTGMCAHDFFVCVCIFVRSRLVFVPGGGICPLRWLQPTLSSDPLRISIWTVKFSVAFSGTVYMHGGFIDTCDHHGYPRLPCCLRAGTTKPLQHPLVYPWIVGWRSFCSVVRRKSGDLYCRATATALHQFFSHVCNTCYSGLVTTWHCKTTTSTNGGKRTANTGATNCVDNCLINQRESH